MNGFSNVNGRRSNGKVLDSNAAAVRTSKKEGLRLKVINSIKGHTNDVTCVQWAGNVLGSGSADKTIRLWKALSKTESQVELQEFSYSPMRDHFYHVQCLHFSSFGNILATCATDGKVVVWDVVSGSQIASENFPLPAIMALRCCRISPDGRLLAAGGDGDAVALWRFDRQNGLYLLKIFQGHEATISCICFGHDSTFLVSGSIGADIRLWDCQNLQDQALCIWRDAHDLGCTCMDIAPYSVQMSNGDAAIHVATGGYDNIVKLWHITDKTNRSTRKFLPGGPALLGHSADICSVRFSNQEKLLISSSSDRTMIIWDPLKSCALHRVGPLTKYVRSCCFSPDDQFIMAGFSGGIIGFFRILAAKDELTDSSSVVVTARSPVDHSLPFQFLDDARAPEEFICPITHELIEDPVVAEDGISYERRAITQWFQKHNTSPHTNLVLASQKLVANINLKALIVRWILFQRESKA